MKRSHQGDFQRNAAASPAGMLERPWKPKSIYKQETGWVMRLEHERLEWVSDLPEQGYCG